MAGRRQGERRWRGSLMAVINDNGPEESWDTGATYIIPSHQSMHLCGLSLPLSLQTSTLREDAHAHKKAPHLLSVGIPPRSSSRRSLWASWMIAVQGNDM